MVDRDDLQIPRMAGIDRGPGSVGHATIQRLPESSMDYEFRQWLLEVRANLARQSIQLFDHSHPVNEYQSTLGEPGSLTLEVMPTYEIPERIDAIIVSAPGAIGAVITLGAERNIPIGNLGQTPIVIAPVGIVLDRNDRRLLTVQSWGPGNPVPSQPAVPATGVAQQNLNAYPVTVVINANGATITAVTVNGVVVGTAAGTYVVPAFGSISISYTVAVPTWVWSDANPSNQLGVHFELDGYAAHEFGTI